jgi:hypothetical protein
MDLVASPRVNARSSRAEGATKISNVFPRSNVVRSKASKLQSLMPSPRETPPVVVAERVRRANIMQAQSYRTTNLVGAEPRQQRHGVLGVDRLPQRAVGKAVR